MKIAALLLFTLLGWDCLGIAGIVLSLARGHRAEAGKHAAWLGGVMGCYLIVLLSVSMLQPQKAVGIGQDQCFDQMCFAVVGVDQLPGLAAGDTGRVVRVGVRVSNRGNGAESDSRIRAYLIDSRGRVWEPLPGLSGNRLTASVAGGSQMLSQPMFRVANDSTSLGLVFTHGKWQLGQLMVGDSDSIGHKRTRVDLKSF